VPCLLLEYFLSHIAAGFLNPKNSQYSAGKNLSTTFVSWGLLLLVLLLLLLLLLSSLVFFFFWFGFGVGGIKNLEVVDLMLFCFVLIFSCV